MDDTERNWRITFVFLTLPTKPAECGMDSYDRFAVLDRFRLLFDLQPSASYLRPRHECRIVWGVTFFRMPAFCTAALHIF